MTKEEVRGKFIKEIPKQIISGEQLSYADWLEQLIVSNYVVNKNDLLQRISGRSEHVICPDCNSDQVYRHVKGNALLCAKCGINWGE